MIVIAWIVLVVNIIISLVGFFSTFTGKHTSDRIAGFISFSAGVLACILSIYIIR